MNLKPIIISAPFGNYCSYPGATSTLGTITLHHLETTLDDVIGGKLRPHLFCKPIPKRPSDRSALLNAALAGESCFALGSDSAPHLKHDKESACGCAGVFTAPVLAQGLVSLFEREHGCLGFIQAFTRFTSVNANAFYGFTSSDRTISLEKRPYAVPPICSRGAVVPYRAGETLPWSLADD